VFFYYYQKKGGVTMKKIIRTCAVLAATVALLGVGSVVSDGVLHTLLSTEVSAATAATATENGITYTANTDGTAKVTAYSGDDSDAVAIVIPETVTINGTDYKVTEISNGVFSGKTNITSADIRYIQKIGNYNFRKCTGLTSVDMSSATEIGQNAFEGCTGLTSVDMPCVETIGSSVFLSCTNLSVVNMPYVTTIGNSAFSGCTGLTTVSMPSVETIGSSVFLSCRNLSVVNMPKVKTIGNSAFNISSMNKTITVYIPEDCNMGTQGSTIHFTKKYVIDGTDLKIEGIDKDSGSTFTGSTFEVIVNTNRFGGSADDAIYLDEVDILVNDTNVTKLIDYIEDGDNIIFYVEIKNEPSVDNEIRAQVHAYDWDKETGKGTTAYYYVTSPETIKPAAAVTA
jgi:hypothetical protein